MDDTLPAALATNLDVAFERLVRSHQDRLYTIALRLLGDPRDAEEVAQDAFVRAYRAIGSYPPERTRELRLRPWLAAIVVNLCRNRSRRHEPSIVGIEEPDGDDGGDGSIARTLRSLDPLASPHDAAIRRDGARRWAALLETLPERYRTPVVLRHVDGLSYDEMATVLGRPEGTIKAQVHRGLAQLRAAAEEVTRGEPEEMTA